MHAGPGNKADLTGGWLNGGPAGNLKMTMPTAFTVSLLSWSMLAFPDGYNAGQCHLGHHVNNQVRVRNPRTCPDSGGLGMIK